jgi:hypothetical protein
MYLYGYAELVVQYTNEIRDDTKAPRWFKGLPSLLRGLLLNSLSS